MIKDKLAIYSKIPRLPETREFVTKFDHRKTTLNSAVGVVFAVVLV